MQFLLIKILNIYTRYILRKRKDISMATFDSISAIGHSKSSQGVDKGSFNIPEQDNHRKKWLDHALQGALNGSLNPNAMQAGAYMG